MSAMHEAAVRWRGRVALISGGVLVDVVAPPCACRGLGLVPRQVTVRGAVKWTFDPCPNGCEENQ